MRQIEKQLLRAALGSALALLAWPSFLPAQELQSSLRGRIQDHSQSPIAGATVTVSDDAGLQTRAISDQAGSYLVPGLAPGPYTVRAQADGFAPWVRSGIVIRDGAAPLNIYLTLEMTEKEEVTVVSYLALSLDTLSLTGSDLDRLPPGRQLLNVLRMLTPSAGPRGGTILVDGFKLRRRLPPKRSIREIRISENPMSAEFDEPGVEKVEIFTKPGSDRLQGALFFNFNDETLNSTNPFSDAKVPFQSRLVSFNIGGPVARERASFFLDLERADTDDNVVINATTLGPDLNIVPVREALVTPSDRTLVAPRFDYRLNQRNMLVARYTYVDRQLENAGVGDFSLLSRAHQTNDVEHTLQLTETAYFSPKLFNESRFQYIWSRQIQRGDQSIPIIDVREAFTGGGSDMSLSRREDRHWELQNDTFWTPGSHSLKMGVKINGQRLDDSSTSNFGGTYTFGGGVGPQLDTTGEILPGPDGLPVLFPISSLERYRRTLLFQQQGLTPAESRQRGGGATQLTLAGGPPRVKVDQYAVGLFIQDDWRLRPDFSLNLGLRYERQNNINGNGDLGPRIGFAWSPGSAASDPSTVIRGAFGIFYDRFSSDLTLAARRFDGFTQQQFVVTEASVLDRFPGVPSVDELASFLVPSQVRVAEDLRSPYTMQTTLKIERQLTPNFTISAAGVRTRTLRALRSRNINAPLPGSQQRPFGEIGEIFQYESSGVIDQNQLILTAVNRFGDRLSWYATYVYGQSDSNTEGAGSFPMNSYDLASEYGRSRLDARHTFYWGGWMTIPGGFELTPLMVYRSGLPFNITTGRDSNGDSLYAERPAFATDANRSSVVSTPYGLLDLEPLAGQAIVPRNLGEGPSFFNLDLLVSRRFSLGSGETASAAGGNRGGRGGFGRNTSLRLGVQITNLLNRVNPASPVGNLSSPLFGSSTGSSGAFGFGRHGGGNRTISLQLHFEF